MDKYPKTPHLPCSPSINDDDSVITDFSYIISNVAKGAQNEVILTEKLDGGNCCFKGGNVYARTHGQPTKHESFSMCKQLYIGQLQFLLPQIDAIDFAAAAATQPESSTTTTTKTKTITASTTTTASKDSQKLSPSPSTSSSRYYKSECLEFYGENMEAVHSIDYTPPADGASTSTNNNNTATTTTTTCVALPTSTGKKSPQSRSPAKTPPPVSTATTKPTTGAASGDEASSPLRHALPSPFYLFAIYDSESDTWLSYDHVVAIAALLSIPTPPLIFRGVITSEAKLEAMIKEAMSNGSRIGPQAGVSSSTTTGSSTTTTTTTSTPTTTTTGLVPMEGCVVRVAGPIKPNEFSVKTAKYVRPGHIQTGDDFRRNWKQANIQFN